MSFRYKRQPRAGFPPREPKPGGEKVRKVTAPALVDEDPGEQTYTAASGQVYVGRYKKRTDGKFTFTGWRKEQGKQ